VFLDLCSLQDSFVRVFRRYDDAHPDANHLLMGFSATLEVTTSRDYKISGAVGPCVSLRKGSPCVSETEIGEGGTYGWSLGGLDPTSTLAIIFDAGKEGSGAVPGKRHYLQLVTYYQHSNGRYRMRVTTTGGMWSADATTLASVAASFDQEAAAVVMGRLAVTKAERDEPGETMRWLDKSLIKLCHNFAEYTKNDPTSFRLAPNFGVFPQFMFHLRRSNFMQILNSSPDEAAYHRLVLCREDASNSMLMIQPSLTCYSFTAPPQPVLLDAASIRPDVILLLDTFFHVLIFHGETIATWREQKFQDMPEHVAFKQLLEQPKEDAAALMENRFPVPRYVVCDQHKSQARFLLSRVNPSININNVADTHGGNPVITDDVPLTIFMEHLVRLAVQED
jgi:protein transport protein SEC23